jgi:hypothetical protein
VCKAFPFDTVSRISPVNHRHESTMKPGIRNDLRLAAETRHRHTRGIVTASGIARQMDNASVLFPSSSREMEDDVEWLEVCKEEKDHNQVNIYLTWDEIIPITTSGTNLEDETQAFIRRAAQNTNIATSVPPELVSNPEYKTPHGLTKAAYQCLRNNYHQLRVAQRLFRRVTHTVDKTVDLHRRLSRVGVSTDPVNWAELAIEHILVLAQMQDLNESLIIGPATVVKAQGHGLVASAHAWVQENWKYVRSMAPVRHKDSKIVPTTTDHKAWVRILKRVLKAQVGFGIRQIRNNSTGSSSLSANASTPLYKLTFLSFWKTLDINVPSYVQWWAHSQKTDFGIGPILHTCCDVCDTDGPPVPCVMQGGLWVCVDTKNPLRSEHRDMFMPIDVGSRQVFMKAVAGRNIQFDGARLATTTVEEEMTQAD